MIPIFIVSLIAWMLIIKKYRALKLDDIDQDMFAEEVISFLRNRKIEEVIELSHSTPGILPKAVKKLMDNKKFSKDLMISIVKETMHEEYPRLEQHLPAISTIASVAPLLGLLGTVSGMVTTFTSITIFGTGDPQSLAKGISEALLTTQSGLIVAIPVLFLHNHLSKKANHIMNGFEKNITKLINVLSKM